MIHKIKARKDIQTQSKCMLPSSPNGFSRLPFWLYQTKNTTWKFS